MGGQLFVFYALAALTVGSAALVVTRRNPVHSALALVVAFLGVAGIYVVLEAEFIAAAQVLVYAGGIMVLFLFVIMLVDLEERGRTVAPVLRRRRVRAVVFSAALTALLVAVLLVSFFNLGYPAPSGAGEALATEGNLSAVAVALFDHYVLPFEVASVLLLVAMIGAVVLAKAKI